MWQLFDEPSAPITKGGNVFGPNVKCVGAIIAGKHHLAAVRGL